jgi:hypothetical protein
MKLKEFNKVANVIKREYKIGIEEGERWAANIKNKKIFYVKNDIYSLEEDILLGLLLHETAHIHYTTSTTDPIKHEELHHSCLNMLEDISIEEIMGNYYPNAKEILESTRSEFIGTLVSVLPKSETNEHEKALLFAAIRFENRGFNSNINKYEIVGEKIAKIMEKNKKLILTRKETQSLVPLTDEIVDLLITELGELTDKQKEQYKQNDHGGGTTEIEKEKTEKQVIKKLKEKQEGETIKTKNTEIEYIDEIIEQAEQIGKKLRTIIKRNNAMEFEGRFRSGKLVAKRLVKIRTQKLKKPFMRKIVKSNKSYAFAIATDVSGSMSFENNISYALSAALMTGEALRIAGIQRINFIFGKTAVKIKEMGKNKINWTDLNDLDEIIKADSDGTNINIVLRECAKELHRTRAERKILIILTDGQSNRKEIEKEYEKAKKQGIECLGITLQDNRNTSQILGDVFGREKNKCILTKNAKKEIGEAFIEILKLNIKENENI